VTATSSDSETVNGLHPSPWNAGSSAGGSPMATLLTDGGFLFSSAPACCISDLPYKARRLQFR